MRANRLLTYKMNVIGVMAVSLLTAVSTVLVSQWFEARRGVSAGLPVHTAASGARHVAGDLTRCEGGVYSPVQNTCVDQETFDAEIQRLFTALGLDPRVYAAGRETRSTDQTN